MRTFQSIILASLFALTACLDEAEPPLADLEIHESAWMDWQTAEPMFESVETGLVVTKKNPEKPDRDLDPNRDPDDLDLDDHHE